MTTGDRYHVMSDRTVASSPQIEKKRHMSYRPARATLAPNPTPAVTAVVAPKPPTLTGEKNG